MHHKKFGVRRGEIEYSYCYVQAQPHFYSTVLPPSLSTTCHSPVTFSPCHTIAATNPKVSEPQVRSVVQINYCNTPMNVQRDVAIVLRTRFEYGIDKGLSC
jgi:hypothetical protein